MPYNDLPDLMREFAAQQAREELAELEELEKLISIEEKEFVKKGDEWDS